MNYLDKIWCMLRKEPNLEEETQIIKNEKTLTNDWPEVNSKGEIQIILFRHDLYKIRFRSLPNKTENMHILINISH